MKQMDYDRLQQSKKVKPWRKGKSDFHSYYIIIVKRPVFKNKNHKAYKEIRKEWPIPRNKI